MKPCSKCGELKPLDDFYKAASARDGRRGDCKACVLKSRAEQYATRPEMRERLIRQAREWRAGKFGAPAASLPRTCRDCGRDMRPNATGSPGLCVSCKRRAGKKVAISKVERLAIYERDGWICHICGRAVEPTLHPNHTFAATLDHLAPRALTLWQDDDPTNLRLAHRACNSARGARPVPALQRRRRAAS